MRSQHIHLRFLIATVAIVLAALGGPMTAGAADEFIPGVTDSTTGVLAQLDDDRFIPGVTDSTTGVLRGLERKGLEPRDVVSPTNAGDSGFGYDTAVAVGAALAAAVAAFASLALFAAARRRRVAI
jgi:hypothetical protein